MRPDHFSVTVNGVLTGLDGRPLGLAEGRAALDGGTVRGRVTLPGLARPIVLETVDADITANLKGVAIDGVSFETADVDASMRDGLVDVRQLDVRSADVVVTAKGPLALAGDAHQSKLVYQVGVTDLSRLASMGVTGATGTLQLDGTIEGSSNALAAAGKFGVHQFKYRNLVDALAVNAGYKAAVPGRDWARLTADVEIESAFLTLRGYDLERLAVKSHYQAGQIDVNGRFEQKARAIELDGSLLFLPDHREVHLRQLTLAGPGSPWQLAAGEAVIRYGEDRVSIERLTFTRDEERIEASGAFAFSEPASSDLRLHFRGLQVGDVYTMAFGTPVVTGTAEGTVDVRGTLRQLDVSGDLQVVNGEVGQIGPIGRVKYTRAGAEFALRQKRLSIDARIDEANGMAFTIKGEMPVAADAGPLDVRVESAGVSLGLAQAFTSHLANVQGQASVNLHATGTLSTPSLAGHVAVAGGGFLVTATGVTYRDLNADIEFQGQRAVAKQFAMTDDDGHILTATGGADVFTGGKDRAFEIAIEADSLQVIQNDLGDVEVDIAIRAEGGIAAPKLTGRIALDQGRLEIDEVLRRIAKTRQQAPAELGPGLPMTPAPASAVDGPVVAEAAPSAETAREAQPVPTADRGLFSRATLDLDIVIPDALVLRGRDVRAGAGTMALGNVNLTIGGRLDLNKSPGAQPTILGSLGVVRGFYEFQGRRFQVTRGSSVNFRGTDTANPTLDITGERDVQGVIARVQVTGSLRRPRLALSSDPALDEGDVLSLIVFNQPINQLGESEQVNLLDRAGTLAMGTLATSLSDSIGRALDVDLFEIRAPGSGEAGELNVGRQVNDRFVIGFQQEFAGGEASRLSFEYQLTDALRILTSVAQGVERAKRSRNQDTAGIDLIYQVRY
jgi:autotransporter translocation and assembly factor TamB